MQQNHKNVFLYYKSHNLIYNAHNFISSYTAVRYANCDGLPHFIINRTMNDKKQKNNKESLNYDAYSMHFSLNMYLISIVIIFYCSI